MANAILLGEPLRLMIHVAKLTVQISSPSIEMAILGQSEHIIRRRVYGDNGTFSLADFGTFEIID